MSKGTNGKQPGNMAPQFVLFVLDAACIIFAYVVAIEIIDLGRPTTFNERVITYVPYLVIFITLWAVTSFDQQPFDSLANVDLPTYAFHVMKSVADALIVSTVSMALFAPDGNIGRQFLLAFGVGTFLSVLALRVAARVGITSMRRRGIGSSRVLIVGANDRSQRLAQVLQTRDYLGLSPAGFLEDDPSRISQAQEQGLKHLGSFDDLPEIIERGGIDEVFITLPVRSFYGKIQDFAELCEANGITLRILADLFPLRIATNRLMYVEDVPLLSLSAVPEERLRLAIKRSIDLFVSTMLLLVLAIPLAIVAIIIKIDSSGPIFFAQERVGQNQRRFKMLKFRSMVVNAEEMRGKLEALNEADGPVFKIRQDPRITKVGRFIRKYSIDEFPQLINVWLGQMSLVGPRPPIASEVEKYTWDQRRRLSVKPGMTGLWQVSGRSDVSFEEWVELDLEYIDTWSVLNDFHILLRTFRAVVQGRGAA